MDDETEIRARIAARAAAIAARDIDRVIADVAEDVVIYELVPPLVMQGRGDARRRVEEWFATYRDGPVWHDGDVTVVQDGDVAFSHALDRVTGIGRDGAAIDMWFRTTLGWRRRQGRWQIVHDHQSVPFDPATGRGRLDLTP